MASPHLRGMTGAKHGGGSMKPPAASKDETFEKAKGTVEQGQPQHGAGVGDGHAKEYAGTKPHPTTGVHAVHIHHMGGGMAKTHTHHDDGSIESQDHGSMAEAKGHADQMLPDDEAMQDQQPEMAEAGTSADDGMASSLGSMAG